VSILAWPVFQIPTDPALTISTHLQMLESIRFRRCERQVLHLSSVGNGEDPIPTSELGKPSSSPVCGRHSGCDHCPGSPFLRFPRAWCPGRIGIGSGFVGERIVPGLSDGALSESHRPADGAICQLSQQQRPYRFSRDVPQANHRILPFVHSSPSGVLTRLSLLMVAIGF
jgi:hypothetical protein